MFFLWIQRINTRIAKSDWDSWNFGLQTNVGSYGKIHLFKSSSVYTDEIVKTQNTLSHWRVTNILLFTRLSLAFICGVWNAKDTPFSCSKMIHFSYISTERCLDSYYRIPTKNFTSNSSGTSHIIKKTNIPCDKIWTWTSEPGSSKNHGLASLQHACLHGFPVTGSLDSKPPELCLAFVVYL